MRYANVGENCGSAEHVAIRGITIIRRGDFANGALQYYKKHTSVSFAICECLRELRECGARSNSWYYNNLKRRFCEWTVMIGGKTI